MSLRQYSERYLATFRSQFVSDVSYGLWIGCENENSSPTSGTKPRRLNTRRQIPNHERYTYHAENIDDLE